MDMLTPALANYMITAQDSDATVQAFNALSHLPGMQHSHSGIIAFSGGVPLACFAAADPRIRTQVAYLTLFGGYFNTTSLLRAFGRRALDIDGKQEKWIPNIVPLQTISNIITQDFAQNEQDLIGNAVSTNTPLATNEISSLSPGAQAAYHSAYRGRAATRRNKYCGTPTCYPCAASWAFARSCASTTSCPGIPVA